MSAEGATKVIRKDVARNRALLLQAAREEFAEHGLDATLDDIAKRAGVGTGTAYRHFANKQEIAAEALTDSMDRIVMVAQDALLIEDPWIAITTFFESTSQCLAQDRGLHETLVEQRGPRAKAPIQAALVDAVTILFERGRAAGVIRADADPTDGAPIISMMKVAFDMSVAAGDPELWRRYLALFLDGLRAIDRPPLPGPPMALDAVGAALAAGKRTH